MKRDKPRSLADYLPVAFPTFMLLVFFGAPFSIMVAISFFRRIQGGFYEPDFVFANYARFLSAFFGSVLGFSLSLAALVAVIRASRT